MYTVYQVILDVEDGEYVKSEWQTEDRANQEADHLEQLSGDGQRYIVQPLNRGF